MNSVSPVPPQKKKAPPSLPADCRRACERVDLDVEVTLGSESNFYAGFTQNISEGGIFIATIARRKLGDHLTVRFTLPGDDTPIQVLAEVRWVRELNGDTDPGLGLRFVHIEAHDLARIQAFTQRAREPLFFDDDL